MAFEFMPRIAIQKVFLSLQNCMIEALKIAGGNAYKLPHMGKDKLIKAGTLPSSSHVDICVHLVHNTIENIKIFMLQLLNVLKCLSCLQLFC